MGNTIVLRVLITRTSVDPHTYSRSRVTVLNTGNSDSIVQDGNLSCGNITHQVAKTANTSLNEQHAKEKVSREIRSGRRIGEGGDANNL